MAEHSFTQVWTVAGKRLEAGKKGDKWKGQILERQMSCTPVITGKGEDPLGKPCDGGYNESHQRE